MAQPKQQPKQQQRLGPVVYASDDSAEAMADAKAYIARFGLTRDDVTLSVKDGQTLIRAKRNFFIDRKDGEA